MGKHVTFTIKGTNQSVMIQLIESFGEPQIGEFINLPIDGKMIRTKIVAKYWGVQELSPKNATIATITGYGFLVEPEPDDESH